MRFDVKRERKNNGSDLQVVTVDRSNKNETNGTFPKAGSTKMKERADIKLQEVNNGNFMLGLYYVMALAN